MVLDVMEAEQIIQVEKLFIKSIEDTRKAKVQKGLQLTKFLAEYEVVSTKREAVYQEERVLEKGFKKEFAASEYDIETLTQLFRSRGPRPRPETAGSDDFSPSDTVCNFLGC